MRWDPLKDILNMQERMNRIFQGSAQGNSDTGDWLPPVDVYETETEVVILAELPGVDENSLDVQVCEGVLTIKGVKNSPIEKSTDSYYRLERVYGKFVRSFTLPSSIVKDAVSASIKDGILTIRLAKQPNTGSQTIKVVKG